MRANGLHSDFASSIPSRGSICPKRARSARTGSTSPSERCRAALPSTSRRAASIRLLSRTPTGGPGAASASASPRGRYPAAPTCCGRGSCGIQRGSSGWDRRCSGQRRAGTSCGPSRGGARCPKASGGASTRPIEGDAARTVEAHPQSFPETRAKRRAAGAGRFAAHRHPPAHRPRAIPVAAAGPPGDRRRERRLGHGRAPRDLPRDADLPRRPLRAHFGASRAEGAGPGPDPPPPAAPGDVAFKHSTRVTANARRPDASISCAGPSGAWVFIGSRPSHAGRRASAGRSPMVHSSSAFTPRSRFSTTARLSSAPPT